MMSTGITEEISSHSSLTGAHLLARLFASNIGTYVEPSRLVSIKERLAHWQMLRSRGTSEVYTPSRERSLHPVGEAGCPTGPRRHMWR